MILPLVFVSVAVALFAVFPLTDTDIWWHLACAREWVTTWTPVREPVVNAHEFFQQIVAFVYNLGGAPLLVAFKAILWGIVFALFLWPSVKRMPREGHPEKAPKGHPGLSSRTCHPGLSSRIYSGTGLVVACIAILFIFRYQFEMRPVVFSLLFLGVYWNILPWLIIGSDERDKRKRIASVLLILSLQWFWCKCQGLYILGLLYAFTVIAFEYELWEGIGWWREKFDYKKYCLHLGFLALLFVMTFLHYDGFYLFGYPMELFDRLVGFSPSAAVFSSEIAENRSPITLLMAGENVLQSALMIVLILGGIVLAYVRWRSRKSPYSSWRLTWQRAKRMEVIVNYRLQPFCLVVTAALALIAERNFVLFLPVLFAVAFRHWIEWHFAPEDDRPRDARLSSRDSRLAYLLSLILIAFLLGVWVKSLLAYDSMVAYQRVPVAATEWMKSHPHPGRLFNDDRAGGYLAFMNPSDSTYIDGRFMLKTADFFENYLRYSKFPQTFLHDAVSQNIDRVVLPLRYYARWDKLLLALDSAKNWHVAYRDSLFVVMDRTER